MQCESWINPQHHFHHRHWVCVVWMDPEGWARVREFAHTELPGTLYCSLTLESRRRWGRPCWCAFAFDGAAGEAAMLFRLMFECCPMHSAQQLGEWGYSLDFAITRSWS